MTVGVAMLVALWSLADASHRGPSGARAVLPPSAGAGPSGAPPNAIVAASDPASPPAGAGIVPSSSWSAAAVAQTTAAPTRAPLPTAIPTATATPSPVPAPTSPPPVVAEAPTAPVSAPAPAPYVLAGEPGCNRVALLFNIGVGEEPVDGIIDTLEREDVPATMFPMGWWVEENPPILQRIIDGGYPIGSHGYGANELPGLTDYQVVEDVRQAERAIEAAIGRPIDRYFTPFAAAIDDRVKALVAAEGYVGIGWEVAAADYGPEATEDAVYERIMTGVHDGAIVELHLDGPASAESTGRALPRVIADLRAQGFRFVTIPEMLTPCPGAAAAPGA